MLRRQAPAVEDAVKPWVEVERFVFETVAREAARRLGGRVQQLPTRRPIRNPTRGRPRLYVRPWVVEVRP